MKKKIITTLVLGAMILGNGVMAFASDPTTEDRDFYNSTVFIQQKNNESFTPRAKQTSNQYSYVKCTGLNGTDKVTFWIRNSNGQISNDVHTGISNYFNTMYYYENEYMPKGSDVHLAFENYYYVQHQASVSGIVDYE